MTEKFYDIAGSLKFNVLKIPELPFYILITFILCEEIKI